MVKLVFLVQYLWPHRQHHNVISSLDFWWPPKFTEQQPVGSTCGQHDSPAEDYPSPTRSKTHSTQSLLDTQAIMAHSHFESPSVILAGLLPSSYWLHCIPWLA